MAAATLIMLPKLIRADIARLVAGRYILKGGRGNVAMEVILTGS